MTDTVDRLQDVKEALKDVVPELVHEGHHYDLARLLKLLREETALIESVLKE